MTYLHLSIPRAMNMWVCLLVLLVAVVALPQQGELNVAHTNSGYVRKIRGLKGVEKTTAAQAMRAFSALRRQLGPSSDETDELERIAEEATGGDQTLLRMLRRLDLFKRADVDPICSMSINCADITNRNFVNGVEYRTASGICNNQNHFQWGMATVQHRRVLPQAYANGKWNPRALTVSKKPLPTSRSISNKVHKTDTNKIDNDSGLSLALFYYMQFLDHDVIRTPTGFVSDKVDCCSTTTNGSAFCLPIRVNATDGDTYFPVGYCMDARRSFTVLDCGNPTGFQNQINEITSYIDASMVYGSSNEEMNNLRSFVAGYLKTSTANFMPEAENISSLPCDPTTPGICFEAGDTRANVIPSLTSYHTIFVREHNRIAAYLGTIHPDWTDEKIYQETRKIVAAEIQHITFNEMLPSILDTNQVANYNLYGTYAYNPSIDASIIQDFSIGFRYHNLMPPALPLTVRSGSTLINSESFNQEQTYEDPSFLFKHNYKGIDQIALGMSFNKCPYANGLMNDAARNKLFLDANFDSYDLATLNIERGREWGTPAYYKHRLLCGVDAAAITTWTALSNTHDADVISKLQSVYESVQDIDLWTGMITERKIGSSISGPTQSCLVAMQFSNLKYGDRFWYETTDSSVGFTPNQLAEIKKVTLAKIMCDNLSVVKMPAQVFKTTSAWTDCSVIAGIDLSKWGV